MKFQLNTLLKRILKLVSMLKLMDLIETMVIGLYKLNFRLYSDYKTSTSSLIMKGMAFLFDQTLDIFPGSCTPGDIRLRWLISKTPVLISISGELFDKKISEADTPYGKKLLSKIGSFNKNELCDIYSNSLSWYVWLMRIPVWILILAYLSWTYFLYNNQDVQNTISQNN